MFTIMFYHIVMVCFSNVNVYNMNIKETEIEIQRERAWYINENEARKTDSQKRKTPIDRQSDKERKLAKESNRQTGRHTGRQSAMERGRDKEHMGGGSVRRHDSRPNLQGCTGTV